MAPGGLVAEIQFRTGIEGARQFKVVGNPFQGMSLAERKDLVMEALAHIGAQNVSEKPNHEIVHSCRLGFGNHPNGDRDPSASINYEKMASGCWVCGGGHFLWWFANVKGLETSGEALRVLDDLFDIGVDRPQTLYEILSFIDSLTTPDLKARVAPPVYDPAILEPWKKIHPYLTEMRGVPAQNIIDLTVGWDERTNRIVIPHFFNGDLLGWQSRRLNDADGTPKYKATPDMPKDSTLYNWRQSEEPLVIVESPMTVVRHNHLARLSATFGASVTNNQMDLMVRSRTKRLILWFDNDEAGWNATDHVADYLKSRCTVYVVENPYAGDPGDLDAETFSEVLSKHVIPWALWVRPRGSDLVVS